MSRTNDVGTQPFDEEPELDYPVDHERTTRQHAGESLKNGANAPGLAGLAVAVVAVIIGLYALATGNVAVGRGLAGIRPSPGP
jgi:hypothetical protein